MSREARNAPWSIGRAAQTVTLSPSTLTLDAGDTATITASWLGDGVLSAVSSNTSIATVSVSGSTITVTGVAEGTASITASVSAGTNYLAGNATASVAVSAYSPVINNYLRFSSASPFTISVANSTKNWNGTLYSRSGSGDWAEWDGSTTLSSSNGTIDFAGSGNTRLGSNNENVRLVISGSNVSCVGNIESLLDYETVAAGGHPTTGRYCYANLFRECTALISAPTLPATTLDVLSYANMFYGCTSLTQAPALPATNLADSCYQGMFTFCSALADPPALPATTLAAQCYNGMFSNCTSLTKLPQLPATTLASGCYMNMFNMCGNIKLSTTQDGVYQYSFRIPTSGTGTTASGALSYMFEGTSGTFTGTPKINTTYYTDHKPVSYFLPLT